MGIRAVCEDEECAYKEVPKMIMGVEQAVLQYLGEIASQVSGTFDPGRLERYT